MSIEKCAGVFNVPDRISVDLLNPVRLYYDTLTPI